METTTINDQELKVSQMAENLVGSEIIKLAGEVKAKIANGEKIFNLTIGDFNPAIFPIPAELKAAIIDAYTNNETNYPMANGMTVLRESVSKFLSDREGIDYSADEILISGGARPLIYAIYQAIVDPGDTVVFPVPSWNNNHYTHLSHAKQVFIETTPENNFMPSAADLKPVIEEANLIAVCSPLNPTGTVFSKAQLEEICDLILEENKRRGPDQKPVYLLFDQIYWVLTHGETEHYNPVSLRPEMRNYTVFVDGLSKAFAATGVRVGWGFGPSKVINKMRAILSHIGAWSPKAEQIASANYLQQNDAVDEFLVEFKTRISNRLDGFYKGFSTLKADGYKVDAIAPQAAIYLTVRFELIGLTTEDGQKLETTADITRYVLNEAKLAIVPFYCFGAAKDSTWYRLSVGTAATSDIDAIMINLRSALSKLS
jgi:aspartate aminotransferase